MCPLNQNLPLEQSNGFIIESCVVCHRTKDRQQDTLLMFWLVQERSTRQQIQKKARCATTMRSLIFLALGHTSRLLRSTNTRIGPATIPASITTATPGNSRVNIIGSPPPRRRLDCRNSSSRMASTTRGDVDDGKSIVVDPFCFRRTL